MDADAADIDAAGPRGLWCGAQGLAVLFAP